MLHHFRYWLTLNHMDRVRRYGLLSHLRFVFNFNLNRVLVNLQRSLADLPPLDLPTGLHFRSADLTETNDRDQWIRLVNGAYPDGAEDACSAERHRTGHAFLSDVEVFFLCKYGQPIATISTGVFRNHPTFGGDARIAVDSKHQGQGLGHRLILFALHHLRTKGLSHCEAVITLMREQSLRLHFKLGFRLQPERARWCFDTQRRMWPVRSLAHLRLAALQRQCIEGRSAIEHNQALRPVHPARTPQTKLSLQAALRQPTKP